MNNTKKATLPKTTVRKIILREGSTRISSTCHEAVNEALKRHIKDQVDIAARLTRMNGRQTIKEDDVRRAQSMTGDVVY